MTGRGSALRIGIDARYLSHALVGGVHTYVARLLPEMIAAAPDADFVLYVDQKAPFELVPPPRVVVRMLPWRRAVSSVWNDWVRLPRWMAQDELDVAFFPANHGFGPAGAATVVTLHDALNLTPLTETLRSRGSSVTMRTHATAAYLKIVTTKTVRRTTRFVTMSEYSRATIVAASGRRPEDITVVHHGAPPKIPVGPGDVESTLRAHGLSRPYVLADGLKNPIVLLRAADRLAARGHASCIFVFFARHHRVLPELAAAAACGRVRLLIRPSTAELAALYSGAAAFAFPSWVEGFGIPLLEAMTYGAPIIASDRGSIPEVAGPAAVLVDAEDDVSLADALIGVLEDAHKADRLRSIGSSRVAQFTWRRSAEQTLAAIRAAHEQYACLGGKR